MLIPSIDLMNGKAVQLRQGKTKVIEKDNVFELLEEFSVYGEVAIIDLDAALGTGSNEALIIELLKRRPCRVGGGIRNLETAQRYIKAGASKIIIGTKCREAWIKQLPKQALIFAIDAKGDYWSTSGWTTTEKIKVLDLIPELENNCSEFLYTQVEKEGMLGGIDRERIQKIVNRTKTPITVAGGITTTDDIAWISQNGANGQIGMSIYTNQLSLTDCFFAQLDWNKSELIPTIVQDNVTGKVLMLAYSNKQSLANALSTRKGIYWSRSRNELWEKGLSSGSSQKLVQADIDCDGDSILFKVEQTNTACHLERYSCFATERKDFSLNQLEQLLLSRKSNKPKQSFTTQLFESAELRAEKLREESEELIEAKAFNDVRWEASDLFFFTLTDAIAKGVQLKDITYELRCRFISNSN